MFENIPRTTLYFLLFWLAVTVVGIIMASMNLSRVKDCRVWQKADSKQFAEGSNGYLLAVFVVQLLALVGFLFQDKIMGILRS